VITAILGWILIVIAAPMVISEGGLPAIGALCIVGVATAITIVDILSVYFIKKGKRPFLPIISAIFWGMVFVLYGISMFSPNQPWQGIVFLGVLVLTALFKLIVSISLCQRNKTIKVVC
jgi:hypothetical protein